MKTLFNYYLDKFEYWLIKDIYADFSVEWNDDFF